jgi:FkbM family methyltransferase
LDAGRGTLIQSDPITFVREVYRVLLGREPEPNGLAYWTKMLDAGLHRHAVVQGVLTSDEAATIAGSAGDPRRCADVDLIIPIEGREIRAPASDRSIVPTLLDTRVWEPHVLAYLREHLRREHVFVDVGANLGYFTVLCAPLVSRVIAFEPVARVRAYCVENVARNGLGNVHILDVGLWHETLCTRIFHDPSLLGGGALSVRGEEAIVCKALDDLVKEGLEMPRLDVVKMDIQGAEVSALLGMRRTLERYRPRIILEVDRASLMRLDRSVGDLWSTVASLGYALAAFEPWQATPPVPLETLDALESRCPDAGLVDVVAIPR